MAAGLIVHELSYIQFYPVLKLSFELSNLLNFPDMQWKAIPLSSSSVAVADLGQGQVSVGDDDPVCPVILGHDAV